MPSASRLPDITFVELDEEGHVVVSDWAAKLLCLPPDRRRLTIYPDGRIETASLADPETKRCRLPEDWDDSGGPAAVRRGRLSASGVREDQPPAV